MTFWKVPSTRVNRIDPFSRWRPAYIRARPIDIHVTSYALLTFIERGLLQEGMPLFNWLTKQRNPFGGFASTQVLILTVYELFSCYTSTKSWSGYIFTAVCLCVCQSVCLYVCPAELNYRIQWEFMNLLQYRV